MVNHDIAMKKNITYLIGIFLWIFILSSPTTSFASSKGMKKTVNGALDFSLKQSLLMYETVKNQEKIFPRTAKDGKLVTCNSHWWTSGFYPGTLWYLYEYSNDSTVLQAAQKMMYRLEREKYMTDSHDVGFIINCSYGNGYRLTKNESYRDVIITAAQSLSSRFNPVVGCTRSWNDKRWQFPVIIDNMMNLELFTVASSLSGDNKYSEMAKSHADKTMQCHFRPDGSSYHLVSYDTISGKILERVTCQGASDESAWARGQAWGLYGFTMMYRETGKKEYLDQAVKIGLFIMNHPNLPKDKIPYWDFNAPDIPNTDRDASAGAIMASAFVELSAYLQGKLAKDFLSLAAQQITSLASPAYRAKNWGDNNNFIIQHCVGFMAKQDEVNAPLAYADYYFVEALIRYKNLMEGRPVVAGIHPL